jgi:hypothetical protein
VVALPSHDATAEALAAAEDWRWVAERSADGFAVRDLASGDRFDCAELAEALSSRV